MAYFSIIEYVVGISTLITLRMSEVVVRSKVEPNDEGTLATYLKGVTLAEITVYRWLDNIKVYIYSLTSKSTASSRYF